MINLGKVFLSLQSFEKAIHEAEEIELGHNEKQKWLMEEINTTINIK